MILLAALVVAGVLAALWVALEMDVGPPGNGDGDGSGASVDGGGNGGRDPGHATTTTRPPKPGPAPTVTGFGTVRGVVRLFKTREFVAGVPLTLQAAEGAPLQATTDASGEFSFAHVPAGAGWELRGGKAGFAPLELTGLDLAPDQTLDVGVLWLAIPVDLPALVVDTTGTPIEGAEVGAFALGRTLPEAMDEWSSELQEQRTLALVSNPRPSRTAKTDAQGRAVVKGLMPGAYRAVASAAGHAATSRMNLQLVPGVTIETVRFVLGAAHSLDGSVLDEKGAPVAGARVIAARQLGWLPSLDKVSADTATDGTYHLDGLAAASYLVYVARAGRPLLQVGQVGIPDTTRFDIRLRPGGTIRGHVTDDAGKPVADADIRSSMQNEWSPMSAKSGKDGAFELKDVPAGPLGYFRVSAAGFIPYPEPTAQEQGSGESLREGQVMIRDVVLRRGAGAWFTVTGDGRGPIEGAEVRLRLATMWSDAARPFTATTDKTGRAQVTGLLAGVYLAEIVAEGWVQPGLPRRWMDILHAPAAFPDAWRVSIDPDAPVDREFKLTRGLAVAGRVFAPTGKPAAGAKVWIDGVRADFPTFTTDDGKFSLETVPDLRRAIVNATSTDGARGASEPFFVKAGASGPVEIHMKEPGRVTGSVLAKDGRTLRGAFVRWLPDDVGADWWSWRAAETGERFPVAADGSFSIPGVSFGRATIRADAEGCLPDWKSVDVSSGNETGGVALLLGAPLEIHGRVQSRQGTPIAGALVSCNPDQLANAERGFLPGLSGQPTARTDTDGKFVLSGLAEGRWGLWTTAPGFAGSAAAQTSVPGGEVLLTLAEGKSITGSVKDPSGKAFPGVPVTAEATDRGQNRGWWGWNSTVYTAPDGTFEIQNVAEGNYRLRVSGSWQWGREVNVEDTVREGVAAGDHDIEITVKPGLVIEGRVVDRAKHPIRVAWVSAAYESNNNDGWDGDSQRWVQAKSDGTFRITGLRPGQYDVGAYGSFRATTETGVAAGATGVEIEVEDAWSIGGVVLDEKGLSVEQFEVQTRRAGESDWDWRETTMPGDGEFVITGLEEGAYDIQVESEGLAPAVLTAVAAGRRDLEVRVGKGLEIGGVVVDASGSPMQGAWISVNAVPRADGTTPPSRNASTDQNGRFHAVGLLPGTYTVYCNVEERARVVRKNVRAGTDDLKLVMTVGTTVSGSVVDAAGTGVADAEVNLSSEEGEWFANASTDAQGRFELRFVPADGKWKLHVEAQVRGVQVSHQHEPLVESGAKDVKVTLP
ncbi:MAG: carboxypeptidase regulatory-like domain-containing protein [Planctomycetes bacterium]|nr:carboxypeptidase regulatory-like domain-containing protein [Planctomycetota bacterium]